MRRSRPLGEDVWGSLRSAICQLLPFVMREGLTSTLSSLITRRHPYASYSLSCHEANEKVWNVYCLVLEQDLRLGTNLQPSVIGVTTSLRGSELELKGGHWCDRLSCG